MADQSAAIEALDALEELKVDLDVLRGIMTKISHPHPAYWPGKEPTAADNCGQLLDMSVQILDHNITLVRTYLLGETDLVRRRG